MKYNGTLQNIESPANSITLAFTVH